MSMTKNIFGDKPLKTYSCAGDWLEDDWKPTHLANGEDLSLAIGLSETRPVVVYFHDPDSAPCVKYRPILDEVCAEYRAAAFYVDVNAHAELAKKHGFTHTPATVILSQGMPLAREYGILSKNLLHAMFKRHGVCGTRVFGVASLENPDLWG